MRTRWNKRSKLERSLACLKPGTVNWSREGGSVFRIMFKRRHALPLPGGRFLRPRIVRGAGAERLRNIYCSWPQTRLIPELKQPSCRTLKRIDRARERFVSGFNSWQQTRLQTNRIRDHLTAVTVREPASAMAIKWPQAIRRHDLSMHANPPKILTIHKFQLARNSSGHRSGQPTSWPASFPNRIHAIPYL